MSSVTSCPAAAARRQQDNVTETTPPPPAVDMSQQRFMEEVEIYIGK
jgi:hypothetical protein